MEVFASAALRVAPGAAWREAAQAASSRAVVPVAEAASVPLREVVEQAVAGEQRRVELAASQEEPASPDPVRAAEEARPEQEAARPEKAVAELRELVAAPGAAALAACWLH